MRRLLLFTFSIATLQLFAQEDSLSVAQDSLETPMSGIDSVLTEQQIAVMQDTLDDLPKEPVKPIQFAIVLDYGKPIVSLFSDETRYEAGLSLLFLNHYHLMGEYGVADLRPQTAYRNGYYESDGSYYRFGGGYLGQIKNTSKLGLSALYGISNFGHQGAGFLESLSGVQDPFSNRFEVDNLEARWLELVLTSESWIRFNKERPEAKINRLFALGFYFRLRFLISYDSFERNDVYSIPGYGRVVNDPQMAANLFLKIYPF